MAKVAFLGLGVMGYPMAGHLLKKGGHDVTVYNRTAAKAQQWAKEYGGKHAPAPRDAGKERADAKRGKIFTRLIREITVAARLGGGDPAGNPRLRLALEKAREQNLPGDNIQRALQRGAGELEGVNYEEIRYEGYGPGGAAVMLDCLSDNRTRTVAEVRHAFTKNGGNLGSDGSVAYLFKHCGQFVFAPGTSEDKVMEAALDAGAEDVFKNDDDSVELVCAPADFPAVKAALAKAGLKPELAEITMKPTMENSLAGDEAARMRRLLEALDGLDDVQGVYTTAVID